MRWARVGNRKIPPLPLSNDIPAVEPHKSNPCPPRLSARSLSSLFHAFSPVQRTVCLPFLHLHWYSACLKFQSASAWSLEALLLSVSTPAPSSSPHGPPARPAPEPSLLPPRQSDSLRRQPPSFQRLSLDFEARSLSYLTDWDQADTLAYRCETNCFEKQDKGPRSPLSP
jgi:hypothetical protein